VKYKFKKKIATTAVTQVTQQQINEIMHVQTKKNGAMADKPVLSHEDATHIYHSTHQVASTVCCRMDHFFRSDLGLKRRLLKQSLMQHLALRNSC